MKRDWGFHGRHSIPSLDLTAIGREYLLLNFSELEMASEMRQRYIGGGLRMVTTLYRLVSLGVMPSELGTEHTGFSNRLWLHRAHVWHNSDDSAPSPRSTSDSIQNVCRGGIKEGNIRALSALISWEEWHHSSAEYASNFVYQNSYIKHYGKHGKHGN